MQLFFFVFVFGQSHGEANSVSDLEVVGQLNMIRDKILAKADPQLHNHLIKLDIPLPLFGMYVFAYDLIVYSLSPPPLTIHIALLSFS